MNVPGLLYQQIMSQLGYLGHAPRDPRDRPRHVHESLAQLQPHEAEAVETMETMSRGRGAPALPAAAGGDHLRRAAGTGRAGQYAVPAYRLHGEGVAAG